MTFLDKVKGWLSEIVEVALLLVALGIVLQVLIGSKMPFLGDVIGNLTGLISALGQNGLVGLIAIAVILWLFGKR
jgi:hypothetical protein